MHADMIQQNRREKVTKFGQDCKNKHDSSS